MARGAAGGNWKGGGRIDADGKSSHQATKTQSEAGETAKLGIDYASFVGK